MQPQLPPEQKKRILVALIGAALALVFLGNFFFWPILKDIYQARQNGNHGSITPLLIFGGFVVVMAFLTVFTVVSGIRKSLKSVGAMPPTREDKPWLKRADWAAGKIKSSATAPTTMFVIMALAFCGMGGLIAFTALPKELHNGNYKALLVLIFPAVGIGFVIVIVRATLAHRRFGDCLFELAQIPAPLGGTLEGMIQTGARLKLEQGLHLKLSCIRRVVTGSGKNQSTQENILWQDEKVFKADASLPDSDSGQSGIPVFFKLPGDQPECYARGGECVFWRLEAKSKMRGPDFSVAFDVPVFKVADAIATDADGADPTAALQEPIDEIRRDEDSRIKITDGPNGREFYFPAARNIGMATFAAIIFLVFSGILYAMIVNRFSIFFEMILGLFTVIFGCFTFSAWCKSSRVTIDSNGVTAVNCWLIFSRTRKFDAGDIARLELQTGMTSGTQTFQDIKLITSDCAEDFETRKARYQRTGERPPLKFKVGNPTIASGISSKPEADWLVAEMTKALGRRA
jgi:ABC-type sugar transport system permease subunit